MKALARILLAATIMLSAMPVFAASDLDAMSDSEVREYLDRKLSRALREGDAQECMRISLAAVDQAQNRKWVGKDQPAGALLMQPNPDEPSGQVWVTSLLERAKTCGTGLK